MRLSFLQAINRVGVMFGGNERIEAALWWLMDRIPKQQYIKSEKVEREKERVKLTKKSKRKQAKARGGAKRTPITQHRGATYAYSIIAIVVVFFLVFYPNIGPAIDRVKANTGVDSDWQEALVWMRDGNNTTDPFEDLNNPDFYYELHQRPSDGEAYQYPDSAYGVMSWWDYGYPITYIAHRIPNAIHATQLEEWELSNSLLSGHDAHNTTGDK